ncbi:hypothetical protein HYU07_05545 [Candidatus Woesearchaeota archaeon]|nr:hypothetical protein [Candidatus Woesearchaeota archaeon]
MKCYKCGGKLEQHVELIVHNGEAIPQNVLSCAKCGTAITHINEYEKTRKQLYPSLMQRIKGFIFGNMVKSIL